MRITQAEADDLQIEEILDVLNEFMDLLYDGNWWTTDQISQALNVSKDLVEKTADFYSWFGAVKYWREKGVVKMSDKLLKLDRSQIPLIPTKLE